MAKPSSLLALLLLSTLAPAGGQSPAGPASPSRTFRIQFEDEALPARQKEILGRYADKVVGWASAEVLLKAAQEQSSQNVTMDRIRDIDRRWQRGEDPDGLATSLARNDCARALQALLAANPGYGEAFVSDSRGALVCMTRRTGDYWQGDEPKWTRSWAAGSGAVFVSKIDHDESTGLDLMHISVPLRSGGSGGRLVGILTVGKLRAAADSRR
jgi:hypothetical protein